MLWKCAAQVCIHCISLSIDFYALINRTFGKQGSTLVQVAALLEVRASDAAGACRSVFARAWLVRHGALPHRELQACR